MRKATVRADDLFVGDVPLTLAAIDRLANELVRELEHSLKRAFAGERSGAASYLEAVRRFEACVLRAHDDTDAGLVWSDDASHPPASIDLLPFAAPLSPWAERYGPGPGTALAIVAGFRLHLAEAIPLNLPRSDQPPGRENKRVRAADVPGFLRLLLDELAHEQPELVRVSELFALPKSELGRLFGVSRQAISQWMASTVPGSRRAKLNAIGRLADILERNLKRERIPGIVRAPAEAYGGLTMLEMIERDRHDELVDLVADSFDWARAA